MCDNKQNNICKKTGQKCGCENKEEQQIDTGDAGFGIEPVKEEKDSNAGPPILVGGSW